MSAPLVTIGLTCFNAEETVARAISSALAQAWPNIELVIVDDRSTDNTFAVAEAAIAGDRRARLYRHERNGGPAASRNTILREAKGEFVAFFDDDDESSPERLAEQVSAIVDYEAKARTALVACYAAGRRRYANGYIKELPAIGAGGERVPVGPRLADWLLYFHRGADLNYGSGVPTCALMARRETFAAVGGFDETLRRVEDADLAIRLAMLGGHFIGTSKALFIQHATAAADKSHEKNLKAELQLVEKHAGYLRRARRYHYARHWPRLRYWHFERRYDRAALELFLLLMRNPIAASRHVLTTAPRRIAHEQSMRKRPNPCE